jgi:hypothetical protein
LAIKSCWQPGLKISEIFSSQTDNPAQFSSFRGWASWAEYDAPLAMLACKAEKSLLGRGPKKLSSHGPAPRYL